MSNRDHPRKVGQKPFSPRRAETLGDTGLGLAPQGKRGGQTVTAKRRESDVAGTPILTGNHLDQPLLLERPQVAGERGTVHHHRLREPRDRWFAHCPQHGQQRKLRRPQTARRERPIVELGDRPRGLAQVEARAFDRMGNIVNLNTKNISTTAEELAIRIDDGNIKTKEELSVLNKLLDSRTNIWIIFFIK